MLEKSSSSDSVEHYSVPDISCELCGMTFSRRYNMKWHMLNRHPDTEIPARGGNILKKVVAD